MKKSVPKKTATKKTATTKTRGQSARARLAGMQVPDDDTIPTLTVRIRKKGKVGQPRKWDYDKLVTYVCAKISEGKLVSDVCRKIGISVPTFWSITRSTETYTKLYAQARLDEAEQMKIYAQKVAEGRDWISNRERKRIASFHRKNKKFLSTGNIVSSMQNNILGRNRLQLDAAKWIAKVTDPAKFGDKQSLAIGGEQTGDAVSVTLRFVDGKGKEVTP